MYCRNCREEIVLQCVNCDEPYDNVADVKEVISLLETIKNKILNWDTYPDEDIETVVKLVINEEIEELKKWTKEEK